jgi:hypothetical protein
MANTLTNIAHTQLLMRALAAYKKALLPITRFANSITPETIVEGSTGQTVKVPFVPRQGTARQFNGTYIFDGSTVVGIDVDIDKHQYESWEFTDTEIANYPAITLGMEDIATQKGNSLGEAVLVDILSVLLETNYPITPLVSLANAFDADDLVDLREKAADYHWPHAGRFLALDPSYMTGLLKDDSVRDASASTLSDPLLEGSVRRLLGFDIYEPTFIPGNGENLVGFAALPNAMAVAMRVLMPLRPNVVNHQVITDPETGLSIGYREWYDPDTGKLKAVIEANYGYKKIDGESAILIQSS